MKSEYVETVVKMSREAKERGNNSITNNRSILEQIVQEGGKEVIEVLKENNLDKPEGMFRFFIAFYFQNLEDIYEEFSRIEYGKIRDIHSAINSAKYNYDKAVQEGQNQEEKKRLIKKILDEIEDIYFKLIGIISDYCDSSKKIDQEYKSNRLKFILSIFANTKNMKRNTNYGRLALDWLVDSVRLYALCVQEMKIIENDYKEGAIISQYEDFVNKKLNKEYTDMLARHAKEEKDKKYWEKSGCIGQKFYGVS